MNVTARWSIELLTICPHCRTDVYLLDWGEFLEVTGVDPIEHGTDKSKCAEVTCPNCGENFDLELVY